MKKMTSLIIVATLLASSASFVFADDTIDTSKISPEWKEKIMKDYAERKQEVEDRMTQKIDKRAELLQKKAAKLQKNSDKLQQKSENLDEQGKEKAAKKLQKASDRLEKKSTKTEKRSDIASLRADHKKAMSELIKAYTAKRKTLLAELKASTVTDEEKAAKMKAFNEEYKKARQDLLAKQKDERDALKNTENTIESAQ